MKKKLTLTLEEELIQKGKVLSAKKGISLSTLLEKTIRSLTDNSTQSFSDKWNQRFHRKNLILDEVTLEEVRMERIHEKHVDLNP